MSLSSMTPRDAFVCICYNMMGVDEFIDMREIDKLFEVVRCYGFRFEEVNRIADEMIILGQDKANELALRAVDIAKQLDDEMRVNLIHALIDIARADGRMHDSELSLLYAVRTAFGM